MANVATSPSLLVPGLSARILFTPTAGNFLRVWVTDAPTGSKFRTELNDDADARIRISALREIPGAAANKSAFEWSYTFDKGGKYLLAIQEYNRGTDFGGSYADDPDALRTEDTVGGEDQSKTITVAQRLVQNIGSTNDSAKLVVYVADDLIRPTVKQSHGEKTPVIIEPTSARAASAIVSLEVKAGLAALENTAATTALGTLSSLVNLLINAFNGHLSESGVHYIDDTAHVINSSYKIPGSPRELEKSVQEIMKQFKFHLENQDIDQIGVGSEGFHQDGASNTVGDLTNATVVQPPTDTASLISALADVHRAYEAHRIWTDGHDSADTANDAPTLSPLLALHSSFLTAVAALLPATPAVSSSAATVLVHGAGFEEKDL